MSPCGKVSSAWIAVRQVLGRRDDQDGIRHSTVGRLGGTPDGPACPPCRTRRGDTSGVGGSTGDIYEATFDDLAGRPEIDADRIRVVGHSEGGRVALLAAGKCPRIARIAMPATPVVPTRSLHSIQTESIGRSMGASDAVISAIRSFNTTAFDAVDQGKQGGRLHSTLNVAERSLRAAIPAGECAHHEPPARDLVSTAIGYATPRFRSLLTVDSGQPLGRVDRPLSLVLGGKDVQVDAEAS